MLAATLSIALLLAAPPLTPDRASKILSARNLGLAQLEEGKHKEARASFARLSELLPDEALPWADLAVAALRENDLPAAAKALERARQAGGERADVQALRAALENARNRPDAMREALAKAASLEPRDLESRWRFVRSVESDPSAPARAKEARRKYLLEIAAASPASLPARLKLLLLSFEAGDAAAAKKELFEVERLLGDADAKTKQYLGEARGLLEKGDAKEASLKVRIVENLLRVTPRYQQSLGELLTNVVGMPLAAFSPALEEVLRPRGSAAVPVALKEKGTAEDPALTLRRVDLMNTGKPEVYALPAPYTGAAFLDYDLDGDLDVYLFGGGKPDRLMRNNLDGSWTDVTAGTGDGAFQSQKALPGDFDRDGDLDLFAIDSGGNLVLRSNLRQGLFKTIPLGVTDAVDVTAEDLNADGALDVVVATTSGVVVLINKGNGTFVREASPDLAKLAGEGPPKALLLADLDNDGFPDLIVSTTQGLAAFRRTGPQGFVAWPIVPKGAPSADLMLALDVDHDGDLDVVLKSAGKVSLLTNEGGNANGWLDVVLEGLPLGSGKVNRAGVGSLVEVKAGDLYVAKTVGLLPTHFGLGAHGKADVVRCLFTNGIPQNLFDQRARASVKEIQQLKGSCPFIYAFNGKTNEWQFVTDALGNAPLGLLYDGVHLAAAATREWLYVDRELLQPTPEGRLLVDYTEELWEAAYLDEATLMAVDHPEGTGIVPNERMVPFLLPKRLFTVKSPRPPRAAVSIVNGEREDVLPKLVALDKVYVDPGPETHYQGVRAEHALVLDLGPVAPGDQVVLYLTGWIFYADTSINVSISQRSDIRPVAPVLEVPDPKGGWRTAIESLGFPAGKTKTMPVDLTGLLNPADPRVRIRTTMAIFWDEAFVTVNDPAVPITTTLLSPVKATLSERGFSRRYQETPDGPALFSHDDVSTEPKWEEHPGFLTRLGDVTELLKKTDDRWVAFQGGDAIRIEYDASRLPPLPPGWRRDWVLVSEGWEKDFDKNTITGQTYDPWPFHAMPSYPYSDGTPYPDPAFVSEWLTRRVGPERFRSIVKDFEPKGSERR